MVRSLTFRIYEVNELYYLNRINIGVDQLHKYNILKNCYSPFSIIYFLGFLGFHIDFLFFWVNLRLSFSDVFDSNFNIVNFLSQFDLKIGMHNWETLF